MQGGAWMDVTFKTENGRFNYRVAGILIYENQLLVMTDERSPYCYLPGGRVSMHELSTEAIKREIREELEIEVEVERLLWMVENLFTEQQSGERFHEIGFYYLLRLKDEELFKRGQQFIMTEGDSHKLTFYWKSIDEVKDLTLYPLFIKDRIANLPQLPEHIVEIKS